MCSIAEEICGKNYKIKMIDWKNCPVFKGQKAKSSSNKTKKKRK